MHANVKYSLLASVHFVFAVESFGRLLIAKTLEYCSNIEISVETNLFFLSLFRRQVPRIW